MKYSLNTVIRKFSLLALMLTASCFSFAQNPIDENKMYVRMVYLVSSNKSPNQDFANAIEANLRNIQAWYRIQLKGFTFNLHPEGVKIFKADVDSNHFKNTPNGNDKAAWGFRNCEAVAKRVSGARFLDPTSIWIVYSDSNDWGGRGGSGFTCMPEEDLYGLTGKNTTNLNVNRWIGGAAHELGHAFGLPHPNDHVQTNKALMSYGWYSSYPENTFLLGEDIDKLRNSPFFYKDGKSILGSIVNRFYYPDGWFEKRENGSWFDFKYDNSVSFRFIEISDDPKALTLFDKNRNVYLKVLKPGGMAYFSIGNQQDWKYVYKVSDKKLTVK